MFLENEWNFFYIILFKKPVPLSAWLIQTQYILGEIISTNDDCKVIKDSFVNKNIEWL